MSALRWVGLSIVLLLAVSDARVLVLNAWRGPRVGRLGAAPAGSIALWWTLAIALLTARWP